MHILARLAAVSALVASGAAQAAGNDNSGFYIAGGIGIASLNATDVGYYDAGGTLGGTGAVDRLDTRFNFKSTTEFSGVIGYDFGRIRSDLELSYARNKVRSLDVLRLNGQAVTIDAQDAADICDYLEVDGCSASGNRISFDGGRVRRLSAMVSGWVDFPIGTVVTPYVGGGLGISGFEIGGEGKGRFAWQLGAGVAASLSDTIALTLDFRHRQAGGTTIEYDEFSGFDIGRLKSNSIAAGVRFTF